VQIEAKGHYPFEEAVVFTMKMEQNNAFPFYVRIPQWCDDAQLKVNGILTKQILKPLSYVRIERNWKNGDKVELLLPMKLGIRRWEANKNSISVNRGPLTYSLKIKEEYVKADSKTTAAGDSKWQENADEKNWPSFEIFPASAWNYGLTYKEQPLEKFFTVTKKTWPADDFPFTLQSVPIVLTAKGKQIPQWKIDQYGLTDTLPKSLIKVDTKEETIELIPMGAARLRISAFPVVQ
jgi:hypothetical protein